MRFSIEMSFGTDIGGLEAHRGTAHFKELVLEKAIPLVESRVRRQFIDS
jgi:hypothetical protein